jgi:hypothetical protein
MKPSDFATITRNVIRDQGFEDFLPVACFPERREIRTLADAPANQSIETIAVEWAMSIANPNEEFLVAFKHSASEFRIVRLVGTARESQLFSAG